MKSLQRLLPLLTAGLLLFMSSKALGQHVSVLRKLSSGSVTAKNRQPAIALPVVTGVQWSEGLTIIAGVNLDQVKSITSGSDSVKIIEVRSKQQLIVDKIYDLSKALVLKTNTGELTYTPDKGVSSFKADNALIGSDDGESESAGTQPDLEALAEFTLPSAGSSGFNIIPTPTISASQLAKSGRYAFGGTLWANSFGLDSLRERVGAKLLLPQTSMFGMNFNLNWLSKATGGDDKVAAFGAGVDLNFLLKKVGFLDTATRKTSDFAPFMFHPTFGITGAFFDAKLQVSFYYNLLFTLTENASMKTFYKTEKDVYSYPQVDVSGIFFMDNANKTAIKASLNMIINSTDARVISGTANSVVPYLKIGLLSSL